MSVRQLAVLLGTLTCSLVVAAPAAAGVGINASMSMPSPVQVGQTGLGGAFTVRNTNTPPNNTESNVITQLRLALSCGTAGTTANVCSVPDPGVVSVDTATGRAETACAGRTFTVSAPDASGAVTLTPVGGAVVLAPPGGTNECTVDFTFSVLKMPTIDADPATPGVQTRTNVLATTQGQISGLVVHAAPTLLITVVPRDRSVVADFDGDGDTDRSVYHDGAWYVQNQATVFLGLPGFIPVPADYDGDGDSDRAVYNDGAWYIQGEATTYHGLAGFIPVPADYDGDGDADRAVYDPATGTWYVVGRPTVFLGGGASDIPVPGDYDGDGDTEPAVYRGGAWYVHNQATVFHGLPGFIPVPGDYDGDGDTDRAVFNDGAWYVHDQPPTVFFGLAGDVPVPGDYDGDGDTDRAVYRGGAWWVQNETTVFHGLSQHIPLPLPQAIYRKSFGT